VPLKKVSSESGAVHFGELKRNKAPGIDAVTVEDYEANLAANIKGLVQRLVARQYRPQPTRRVYIPKPNGDKRPLGIPAVEDKIVQMACKLILEAVFGVDFQEVSYGFRSGRGAHDALDALDRIVMTRPVNYVVDADIERFFDTVNHEWLMRCLGQRIVDSAFLRLIARFPTAGVVSEGRKSATTEGTPQGSVLSPVLANIYLHYVLDLWFERKVFDAEVVRDALVLRPVRMVPAVDLGRVRDRIRRAGVGPGAVERTVRWARKKK